MAFRLASSILLLLLFATSAMPQSQRVVIGSKNFTESYVLAEIMAQLLESDGFTVERRFGFGGTRVAFEALRTGEIDIYPEYSGTITETILEPGSQYGSGDFVDELEELGIQALQPFGFNNTYALVLTQETAERLSLANISDLVGYAQLRFGLSHEFRDRTDGWPGLKSVYALPQTSFGIEHGLAYRAMLEQELDVTDAYSTDADLDRYELVVLTDDRRFFPSYLALPLVRRDLQAQIKASLDRLAGQLDDVQIRALNAEVAIGRRSFGAVAADFLQQALGVRAGRNQRDAGMGSSLLRNTLVHLKLTGIAVSAACLIGLGLALAVYRSRTLSRSLLYVTGLLQTIPSIALLALMIPIVGVGQTPAIIALFLYSLLPIVRNAITALLTVDPLLRRVAAGMGLSQSEQLKFIYLPLALPHLFAGLRIATVISIGTATLAAFIGAGGLGEPIVTGLALNDTGLILQGAIPAALLALATEIVFELLERKLVPRHLMTSQLPS